MHLLLRKRRLAPAEVAHHLGTVRKRLPGPQSHHAIQRRRVPLRPVHRAGLLLHHPPAATIRALAHAAVQVVVERRDVGVAGANVLDLLLRRQEEVLGEAQRVTVPGRHVEVGRHVVVVELGEEAHEVVDHIAARRQCAQQLHLLAVEGHHLVRRKPPVVEPLRRVAFGDAAGWQVDLVEVAEFVAPEHVAPSDIQGIDGLVAALQPTPKTQARRRAVTQHGVVAAVFVVGLPGRNRGVLAVAFSDDACDALRLLAVGRARKAIVAARAEAAHPTIGTDRQDLRVRIDQPLRWRGGRCAHHDLQALRMKHLDRAVEPSPLESAGLGLDAAPRKFGDAHEGDAHLAHALRVLGPPALGPVFWVVANAEPHDDQAACDTRNSASAMVRGTAMPLASNTCRCCGGNDSATRSPALAKALPGALTTQGSPGVPLSR